MEGSSENGTHKLSVRIHEDTSIAVKVGKGWGHTRKVRAVHGKDDQKGLRYSNTVLSVEVVSAASLNG